MQLITFAEITKQVHLINDMILSDMTCENNTSEEALSFSKHLLSTKYWFARISWAYKKRYVLALLEDVRSAWALSLLLKSIWNCRPKDAVLSVSEQNMWSSYDQVPLDHSRTAIPVTTLAQVMKSDRVWFLTLEPEAQAMVLSELLSVAGGPIMWEVLRRANVLYDRYREQQLRNLQECIVINDEANEKHKPPQDAIPVKDKKGDTSARSGATDGSSNQGTQLGKAQKELEVKLLEWDATIKAMRDSCKLEEVEMRFNDGTTRKIWKVNRPKPEMVETVGFVQMLPSRIGKLILSYLPRAQLVEIARVNKYYAFLVDEYRAELTARQKIDADFDKLQENFIRHDTSMDLMTQSEYPVFLASSQAVTSAAPSAKMKQQQPSMKASEKSGGAYSLRRFMSEKMTRPIIVQKPIRNMAELSERLDSRGATDENIWQWCENILKHIRRCKKDVEQKHDNDVCGGVLPLGNVHFPCPLMKQTVVLPLDPPLYKDPSMTTPVKPKRNLSNATVVHIPKEQGITRYSLWTKDFSRLYPVFKIPSYQYPA